MGPIRRSTWVALETVLSLLLRCCGSGPAASAERRKGGQQAVRGGGDGYGAGASIPLAKESGAL
jgi:hypothetical protein